MQDIIFGPIFSRRFGKSLGVDLSPKKKQCNFDCLYCELEGQKPQNRMQEILSVDEILEKLLLHLRADIDVLTITANGEPTLYPYLYELISKIKLFLPKTIKTLILSNGSRFGDLEIQKALLLFDIVKFSLDSAEEKSFLRVDRPHISYSLEKIKKGILDFSSKFKGQLVGEILFVKGVNDTKANIQALIEYFALFPHLSRIDLNTIDRPPAYHREPISEEKLLEIKAMFDCKLSIPTTIPTRQTSPMILQCLSENEILELLKHRPVEMEESKKMFDQTTLDCIQKLCQEKRVVIQKNQTLSFFTIPKKSNIRKCD